MRTRPPVRAVKRSKLHSSTKIKLAFAFCINQVAYCLRDAFVASELQSIGASFSFFSLTSMSSSALVTVETRLRDIVPICAQQLGFMPRKSTTDAIFALRVLIEKYREGKKELHCVFIDLEKAYDRVPREELWYCMRKSEVAEM